MRVSPRSGLLISFTLSLAAQRTQAFHYLTTPSYPKLTKKSLGSPSRNAPPRNPSKLFSSSDDNDFFDGYDEFIKNLERQSVYGSVSGYDVESQQGHQGRRRDTYSRGEGHNGRRRRKGYIRDPNDDMSVIVDEILINDLIRKRSRAQFERDYDLADKIRDDLNQIYGVYLWDKDGVWTTSRISPRRRSEAKPRKDFGRHGHDYVQIGLGIDTNVCPLAIDEIHKLLAKRLQFKLAKEYRLADEIQSSLFDNGVRIHDKLKQWRADGNLFQDIEGAFYGNKYAMNEFSETIDESLLPDVQRLVEERENARSEHDYRTADDIRNDLWKKFRIAVDDKSRTWSVGGDFGPNGTFKWTDDGPINPRVGVDPTLTRDWRKFGEYTQSTSSKEIDDPNVKEEVINLVHDRLEAKRVRDYSVADEIRDHLFEVYNVSVDDKLRQWSAGGDFGVDLRRMREVSPTAPDGKKQSSFVRVYNNRGGNGDLSERDVLLVEALVQRYAEELARYNKQAAKSIYAGLRQKYSIILDDANGEWYVKGKGYVLEKQFKGPLPTTIKNERGHIEKMIRERSQAKAQKDYERADKIEYDLMTLYRIKLNDRLEEWTVMEDVKKVKEDTSDYDLDTIYRSQDSDVSVMQLTKDDSIVNDDINNIAIDSVGGGGKKIIYNAEIEASTRDRPRTVEDEANLSTLTVPLLKEKLRAAGLRVSGKKAVLIRRILDNQY